MEYTLTKEFCLVSVNCRMAKAEDLTTYSVNMIIENPEVAFVPNIWDFRDVEICGELSSFEDLHDEIAPLIKEHVKVAFVTNLILTGAILKHYSDMFSGHKYLHFETFIDMNICRQWALNPDLK